MGNYNLSISFASQYAILEESEWQLG